MLLEVSSSSATRKGKIGLAAEKSNLLGLVIFEHLEIRLVEIGDELLALVDDCKEQVHQPHIGDEGLLTLRRLRLAAEAVACCCANTPAEIPKITRTQNTEARRMAVPSLS